MTARTGAGARLRSRISKSVEWDARETELLRLAMDQADDIERLEDLLDEQGLSVVGSQGQTRMNPLITELRLQRTSLAKLLAELRIPTDEDAAKDPKKQRAAEAMHSKRRSTKGGSRLRLVNE